MKAAEEFHNHVIYAGRRVGALRNPAGKTFKIRGASGILWSSRISIRNSR